MMLEDFGLEPERFRLEWIASSEAQKFADVMTEMTEQFGPWARAHTAPEDNVGAVLEPPLHVFGGEAKDNDHTIGPERSTAKNSCGTASSTTVTTRPNR